MTENIQICGDRKLTIIDGQYDVGNVCCKEQVGEYVLCKKNNKDDGGKKTKKELASECNKLTNDFSNYCDELDDKLSSFFNGVYDEIVNNDDSDEIHDEFERISNYSSLYYEGDYTCGYRKMNEDEIRFRNIAIRDITNIMNTINSVENRYNNWKTEGTKTYPQFPQDILTLAGNIKSTGNELINVLKEQLSKG